VKELHQTMHQIIAEMRLQHQPERLAAAATAFDPLKT
jgi:hypothetical protein